MNVPGAAPTAVVERTFRSDPATLWDLWTTRAGFESWWGPHGFHAEVHELNLKEGGELRFDLVADTRETTEALEDIGRAPSHATTMRYMELKPGQRIVLRCRIDSIAGVRPYDNDLTVEFSTQGDQTRMTVTQEGMHTAEHTQHAKEALERQLDRLERAFR